MSANIRIKSGKQQMPTEGVTGEKAQVRDDLEDKLVVTADAIAAFAAKNADPALAALADYGVIGAAPTSSRRPWLFLRTKGKRHEKRSSDEELKR